MVSLSQILGLLLQATRRRGLAMPVFAALSLLTGCGQKGPLFMPVPPPAGTVLTKMPPAVITPGLAPAPVSPASAAQ